MSSGMVHTAKRLVKYANNYVIHIDQVSDPVLLRLINNDRTLPLLRQGLKEIDHRYEILIPYKVDDEESQLKRYIQWKLGTTVNLSTLRRDYLKYYLRLYDYGSPADVIRRWGLVPAFDRTRTEEEIIEMLEELKDEEGVVRNLRKHHSLYMTVRRLAKRQGLSIAGYLKGLGIKYVTK